MSNRASHLLLCDWGDTLMRDYAEFSGPMADWPRVAALPGALEALQALAGEWTIAIATNAADSDEALIRRALRRAGLDELVERVYCFRNLGAKKPAPEFFQALLADAVQRNGGQPLERTAMLGDSFKNDVLGAVRSGIPGIWLNTRTAEERSGPGYLTIHDLSELPGALAALPAAL